MKKSIFDQMEDELAELDSIDASLEAIDQRILELKAEKEEITGVAE